MSFLRKLLILSVLSYSSLSAKAQRSYAQNSVLSSGVWYKLSIAEEGVYKLDLPFMNNLGISGSIPSSQLRVFGNTGTLLPEANKDIIIDDLQEISIQAIDGGDGVLNGSDYILFYSKGPNQWVTDSVNRKFLHKKNIYSDRVFYFLTLSGNGKRIPVSTNTGSASTTVNSFDERSFHELDTANFLSSGKEWFGEEFSSLPGRSLSASFLLPITDLLPQQASINSYVAARSINTASRFNISVNNQLVQQLNLPPITSNLYDRFAQEVQRSDNFILSQNMATVSIAYTQGSFNSQGWLNWFEFFCRRQLVLANGKQLLFRDWNSVGSIVEFQISNSDANAQVWDVTNAAHPIKMNTSHTSNQTRFTNDAATLKEYIIFSGTLIPQTIGRIANQNLHNTTEKDFLIVTHPEFLQQAERLAEFHRLTDSLRAAVVTTDQIFNEFSGGIPDPTAIRDFVKMYYDRYRTNWNQSGKYLLLFGKASFDYKNRVKNNTNFVPAYESLNSLDPLSTYTSDDFFGFLDDNEDINSGLVINELDIAIGRIPVKNAAEAKNFVDKVYDYFDAASFGPWRNNLNFIADDEDLNLHLQDAESLTATVTTIAPVYNQQKIYLDAFRQESGSAGGRYPQANAMINSNIFNGTLVWNFNGHGGPHRLAEEVVIDQQIVDGWNNKNRLPLFITATCDFAPYDHPSLNSLGENLLVRPKTGSIALLTTARLVFSFSNRIMNNNYLKFAFETNANGRYKTLGEALRLAKNHTYQTSADIINNRKFALLGDPAMTLAFPKEKVRITKVNGKDISTQADTLSATELVLVEGEVYNQAGVLLNNFNGTAYLSLFDKIQNISTLANDPTSLPVNFQSQENGLFKGKSSIQNGKFSFKFRVPKDINFQYGNGKLSLYAVDGIKDGNGFSNNIIIGGIASSSSSDNEGPEIKAYLNDERFVNGSISNPDPVLILQLADSSGINTGGSGIGHDIVVTIDDDNRNFYILNNFYEADLDSYQKGNVRFQLPEMTPGVHNLKIKAWDVLNNSSEYVLEFNVVNSSELKIDHVLNYPNPFTTKTSFWFEHNQPGVDLNVKVEIFTVSGKLIKSLNQTINNTGNRSSEIEWDGRDNYGNKPGHGVYIYRLRVRTADGKTAEKWERLVLFSK